MTVVLVGADGSGKSSLAALLVAAAGGSARREHYRPRRSAAVGVPPTAARPLLPLPLAVAKLLLLWAEQWVAAVGRRERGALLVVERGFWDQAVDPRRYRLPARCRRLVVLLGRLTPRADIAVLLAAPGPVTHARKPELPPAEIDRQAAAWRTLLPRLARVTVEMDATRPLAELLAQLRTLLEPAGPALGGPPCR